MPWAWASCAAGKSRADRKQKKLDKKEIDFLERGGLSLFFVAGRNCNESDTVRTAFSGRGEPAALITFLMRLTCRSVGKIGKKCLHLGSFDDRIKMLQYAQKRGVQEGEV